MFRRNSIILSCLVLITLTFSSACHRTSSATQGPPLFKTLDHLATGLDFSNTLHPTNGFNVFDYMYFYNGGGIGAADLNNDGKIDLFLAANQGENKLYLNTGKLHFKDVTKEAAIPQDGGWSTGVSVVDINNDGLLDIYVCRVGHLGGLPTTHNQLLICKGIDKNGVPTYEEHAKDYGLDFSGFSTQAAFFDYDGDGDLDMYLLNHSIHQNGTFGPRLQKLSTANPYSGDHLYRNDGNGKFTEVTAAAGIHSSVIGFGLGLVIADVNQDGYPDIYVGNDFHENDYLYINQRNGTFKEELNDKFMHTSQYTMGVDIADANNDGLPDIVSMDMLPFDPYILKRSEGEDTWDIYNLKISNGYNHQYTRNNLQFNRGNGQFSEIGLYAGIAATDWSWSPLWVDFDNDGLKDLFISNGIPKRLNDIDYINFISDRELQQKMKNKDLSDQDLSMINKFPEIKLPSKFFHNTGKMQFADQEGRIEGEHPTFSNGAVYADLDNDGDLDIVVNNIDEPILVYQNLQNDNDSTRRPSIDLSLKGPADNGNALGARVFLFCGNDIRSYEKYPVRGFMSSSEIPLHIGLFETKVDSAFLVWPDNTCERFTIPGNKDTLTYRKGLPAFDFSIVTQHHKNPTIPAEDITTATGLLYKHEENDFREFDREPLIPHMLSTEGPAVAVGDVNGDGLDDVYISASKWKRSGFFIQNRNGKFIRVAQPALDKDSAAEYVDACFIDVNNDGKKDLVVAPGGNEYYGQESWRAPHVYLNDGKGLLQASDHAFDSIYSNASCITPCDFNHDGNIDLFMGGRSIPFDYGSTPRSYLLQNDGKGHFTDVTDRYAPGLGTIGLVTSALWYDLDNNGQKDLLITLEWGGILAFLNHDGHLTEKTLTAKKGWWNFVLPVDINHDGKIDLVAGNLGWNSRLKASEKEPVRLYHYDFDGNGRKEQILTYYINGRELPFANKQELEKQIPSLKKNFLYAEDFAKASLSDLFSIEKLRNADTLTADYFSNAVLINQGNLDFRLQALPWEAQLSPYRDAAIVNAERDSIQDVLLVGNYYENNIQMGRYDADFGTILKDASSTSPLNGIAVKGQIRHIRDITIGGKKAFLLVRNNDSAMVIRFPPAH